MNASNQEILLAAELILAVSALSYCLVKKSPPFPFLFLAGATFYWLLPLLAVAFFESNEAKSIYRDLGDFRGGQAALQAEALFLCFTCLALVGHSLGVRLPTGEGSRHHEGGRSIVVQSGNEAEGTLRAICISVFSVLGLIFLSAAFLVREDIMSGYQESVVETHSVRGTLSACAMSMSIVAAIGLIRYPALYFRWLFTSLTGWVTLATWVVLLGLGGRLYVASSFLIGLLLCTDSGKGLTEWLRRNIYLVALIGLLVGWIGVSRIGETVSADGIFINIISESLWTGYSMLSSIHEMDKMKAFEWPENFLTSSIGMVPSSLVGDKQEHIVSLGEMGYDIASPQGACNVFASVLCNFGIAGGCVFFFLFGYINGYIWSRRANLFERLGASPRLGVVVASVALSTVPFTFFRDPFSVSFYQMFVKNALVIPLGIGLIYWLTIGMTRSGGRVTRT